MARDVDGGAMIKKRSAKRRRRNPPRLVQRIDPELKGKALREYIAKHWGHHGEFSETKAVVVDPTHGALVILGRLESITYSTRKGGGDRGIITDYEHDFGGTKPWLAFHVCHDPKCASRGKLVIAGGSYHTESRGIVG